MQTRFTAQSVEAGGLVTFLTLPVESKHSVPADLWALLGDHTGNTGGCSFCSHYQVNPSPQHRGCIQFLNKAMQRPYYVVSNTDLVPAHTTYSGVGDGCESKGHRDTYLY